MLQKLMQALMPPERMIEMFTYKIISNQPIVKISEKIPSVCEKYKFALLQTYVYHEIVESKGFPINRKVFIYEICQAKTAAKMLAGFPHFSIFMPCKLAVYEDNGKTVISTMNMEIMLKAVLLKKEKVRLCGSCAEARGLKALKLVDGAGLSTMKELTQWTIESDKVITFCTCTKI